MTDKIDPFPMLHDGSTKKEPWDHRFRPLAKILGCSDDDVASAFQYLELPEYLVPAHLDSVRDAKIVANRAISSLRRTIHALDQLPDAELKQLYFRGSVTVYQLRNLLDMLQGTHDAYDDWYGGLNRKGGRNLAAHTVAEGVRRAFRRQRKRITFGVSDGVPTTDFGRAVEVTLAAFGISADWTEPAQAARDRQRSIEIRLSMMQTRRLGSR